MNLQPSSIEDFIKSSWYKKLITLVKGYHLGEPVKDTISDIFLIMIEKDYLARWDESKGSYSNWIYTFSSNICRKKYNRSHSMGGYAIENAFSIEISPEVDLDFGKGICFEEMLVTNIDNSHYNIFCEQVEKILSVYVAHSSHEYENVVYNRDLVTVFRLLRQEYTVKEISVLFGTSIEFIYTLIRKMRIILKSEKF